MYNTSVPQPGDHGELLGISCSTVGTTFPKHGCTGNIFITNPGQSVVKTHCCKDTASPGIEFNCSGSTSERELNVISQVASLSSFPRCSFNLVLESFLKDKSHFNRRKTNTNPSLCLAPLPHQWQQTEQPQAMTVIFSMEKFH